MEQNNYLEISDEIQKALLWHLPIVALESTIISHGMPYPQNVETALEVEKIVREHHAIPATIAIIGGKMKVGLSRDEITYLGKKGQAIPKVSRRDLPVILARGMDGATTVATTMLIANKAGIKFFATGGIGGVHRDFNETMDVSADLEELSNTPVFVICAGCKSILDIDRTLEYLETKGVPALAYQTKEFPAFFTPHSHHDADTSVKDAKEAALIYLTKEKAELKGGMVLGNPIPEELSVPSQVIDTAIEEALKEAKEQKIQGKQITPFLLAKVNELTKGKSLESNIALVYKNAALASDIAFEYRLLTKEE
jgi:pseudouridine-5'-phosphate glycosidase